MILTALAPYDFHLSMEIYNRRMKQAVDYYADQKYRRVLCDGDQHVLIEARNAGDVEHPAIEVTTLTPRREPPTEAILSQVKWILGLDYDLRPFYSLLAQGAETARLQARLYGLKPIRSPDPFEALVVAITEQQITLAAALTFRARLAERFGPTVDYDGFSYRGFPPADKLASADASDLQRMGITRRKAETLIEVSRRVVEGHINFEILRALPSTEAIQQLTRIKGVGPWTVAYMLSRGLGRYDTFGANDVALKAALNTYFNGEPVVTDADVAARLSTFGEYAGYTAYYLILAYAFDRYPPRLM